MIENQTKTKKNIKNKKHKEKNKRKIIWWQCGERTWSSLLGSAMKNPLANARDVGDPSSTPGLGWYSGGGHDNPLQYTCLENPMDWGAWRAMVYGVTKSWTWLKWLSMHALIQITTTKLTSQNEHSCVVSDKVSKQNNGRISETCFQFLHFLPSGKH